MINSSFPKPVSHPMTIGTLYNHVGHGEINSGAPETLIESVASPDNASYGSLVFCNRSGSDLEQIIKECKASVIIAQESVSPQPNKCIVVTSDALHWFIRALHYLMDLSDDSCSISETARIASDAILGSNIVIGPGAIIAERCSIGNHASIGANCFIGPGTIIGENCFIQNNTTIGSVGLGYHFTTSGERVFFPHLGSVIIESDVVIGSGCVIVRGQLSDTRIGRAARLGNLVNVGHNVEVGSNTAISSNTCIAGGVRVGCDCNIAAGVIINAKVMVGDNSTIGLGSVVTKSIPEGKSFFGNPARPLPTMRKF